MGNPDPEKMSDAEYAERLAGHLVQALRDAVAKMVQHNGSFACASSPDLGFGVIVGRHDLLMALSKTAERGMDMQCMELTEKWTKPLEKESSPQHRSQN